MNVPSQAYQYLKQSSLQNYARELAELIEPSIRIRTHADESLSCSHFGGLPEVPANFELPMSGDMPLTYLGQIHLDELPQAGTVTGLPQTGILYYFYDFNDFPPDSSFSSHKSWRCIYLDDSSYKLKPINTYDDRLEKFPRRSLTFDFEWMLSSPEHKLDRLNQLSDELGESLGKVVEDMCYQFGIVRPGDGTAETEHRLLGYPTFMQNLMERECQLRFHNIGGYRKQSETIENGVKDWQLLLQIDSDKELNWEFGDTGKLYFWIRRQELAKHDFSNVWLIFQGA